jgi:putative phosphoesterase
MGESAPAPKRIGFLADTHSRKDDGSDLPDQALAAFAGCDLIVHLGDVGKEGVLNRLREIAPVRVPQRGKGETIEAGDIRIGITFDITRLGVASSVDENGMLPVDGDLGAVLAKKFGASVNAVAFGGTHRQFKQEHAGVLFFNPGSPNLPSDRMGDNDLGSVAILEVAGGRANVELVRLSK